MNSDASDLLPAGVPITIYETAESRRFAIVSPILIKHSNHSGGIVSSDQPITAADKLRELKLSLNPDINYQLNRVFPVLTGWFINGQIKKKHTLIKQAEGTLLEILRPGEEVLYVAKGIQYSFWEQYFLGIWANLINQTVFVLTNARLLMLHTNTKGKPKDMYWMIYYSQVMQFKANWHGAIVVKLQDGKTFKFAGFSGTDKKQMPQVFQDAAKIYQERGFDPPVSQSRENLCYHCFAVVPKATFVCPGCGAEYWKPSEIAFRSLFFPSWGDFLMRHYLLACMELFGYLASWLVFGTLAVLSVLKGETEGIIISIVMLATFLVFTHIPDAILTYYIANKGLNRRRPPDPSRIEDAIEPEA